MKRRLAYSLAYAIFWLLFFEASRAFFLIYNYALTTTVSFPTTLHTFVSGFSHDVSMLGYLVEMSLLVMCISVFLQNPENFVKKTMKTVTLIVLIPFSYLTVVDAELYRNWGYRTDCSVLQYLSMPKEAFSSIPLWHSALLLVLFAVLAYLFYRLYKKLVEPILTGIDKISIPNSLIFIILMGLTVIPIRGGFGVAALRTGSVYFSTVPFANHAAINDHWHFLYSFGYSRKEKADIFMEQSECDSICSDLLHSAHRQPISLLNTKRPNVLLFILESFTAPELSVLGGESVATNLDSIARFGVLFSNCYSSGTKSEMGIVSILSGYPAQPTTAIIKYTEKAEKLPYLSKIFDSLGYNLSLYHGGDIRFGNMNSYFRNGGFENCVTRYDFDSKEGTAKWGIYDHVVFNRMFEEMKDFKEPFFTVCYTLSSHEPYDVPMKSKFYGVDDYSKFQNSVHYTDSCIGDFMRKARNEKWWNNTLVVFISDHGSRISKDPKPVSALEKYHIPMIWTGGAVTHDTIVTEILSQCDFPMMLCNQLELPSEEFTFSKDILRGDKPFVFYAFKTGFGYMRNDQAISWDNTNSQIISATDNLQDTTIRQGKAFLQKVTTDFCEK